ncbi:radical SAM protein [Pelagibacteraceae bacterium]|nr:radical SAM protein [Pelagibacteraceae bacterium]
MTKRLDNYNYMKNLTDWVSKDSIFNKEFVWPRQFEIHLPSNKEIACDFKCFYCQGSKLDMGLGMDEKKALKLVEEIGPDKMEYYVYGGAYTEPLLNPYFMDFIRLTKKNNAFFGIHSNGSQLKKLQEKDGFCTELISLMKDKKDYFSCSLDAGSPKSHMKTKNINYDAWTDIIEGLRILVSERKKQRSPGSIRVAYLLNRWNSNIDELTAFIDLMKEIKVDSLRFSIPYAQYGQEVKKVQNYKEKIEMKKNIEYRDLLEPYMSKDTNEKPFIFYFAPYNQDIDRMLDENYKQCAYTYYQTTMGSSGHIYRCSSIATPSFDYGILGKQPETVEEFKNMIKISQDKEFHCHTCIHSTARCNRMALEINSEWNKLNHPHNKVAKTHKTEYEPPEFGPDPNKSLGKHKYVAKNLRWGK